MSERLSDEELEAVERSIHQAPTFAMIPPSTAHAMLAELRALRLTDAECEALEEIRRAVSAQDFGMPGIVSNAALAVLNRLLSQGGGK